MIDVRIPLTGLERTLYHEKTDALACWSGMARGQRREGRYEDMSVPTLDRARAALREADAERSFWERHALDLRRQYPDQFVAVRNGEVVASGAELPDLIAQLEAKGISPSGLWIRFLATDPRRLLL